MTAHSPKPAAQVVGTPCLLWRSCSARRIAKDRFALSRREPNTSPVRNELNLAACFLSFDVGAGLSGRALGILARAANIHWRTQFVELSPRAAEALAHNPPTHQQGWWGYKIHLAGSRGLLAALRCHHSGPTLLTMGSSHLRRGLPVRSLARCPSWPQVGCFNVDVSAPDPCT